MMQLFEFEKQAGLTPAILSNTSIAYLAQLSPLKPDTALAKKVLASVHIPDIGNSRLYFMEDILVTTGRNKNTDYFHRLLTWAASESCDHMPLNFEHDETRIIGHITASQVVDVDFNPIDKSTPLDQLPEKFHILNGSVIYKIWVDDEQSDLIAKTIAEIEAGEWFVSMECIFNGFDYVLTGPDGRDIHIPRTAGSAYLTAHLRQYGGSGVYLDKSTGVEYQISRLLKNIEFSGKGLVRRPANPESIILSKQQAAYRFWPRASENLGYSSNEISPTLLEQENMSDNTEKVYQDRIVALEAEVKRLHDELGNANVQAAQASIATLQTEVTAKANEISQLTTQNDALKSTIAELNTQVQTAEAGKVEAETELAKVRASQKRADRIATLVSKGASQEDSASWAAKFESLTDEQFADIAEAISASFPKKKEEDEKDKDKDKEKKTDATTVIDNATVVEEPALASASEAPAPHATRVEVAKFFQRHLKYNAKVKID